MGAESTTRAKSIAPGRFTANYGTLTKRPMDFSSQKFCNETSLGQGSPYTKYPRQICDKTSPFSGTDYPSMKIKLGTIFSDKTSLTHKKLLRLQPGPGGPLFTNFDKFLKNVNNRNHYPFSLPIKLMVLIIN
jgi:hypothetical protein